MEVTMRWHRLLRALAFSAGLVLGLGAAVFIFSNLAPIDVHWRIPRTGGYAIDWTLNGVSVWLIGIVPLLVGAVAGYFYQTPARMHHVREALRHRHRVHELEHELKEARTSLDRLLMLPDDGRPAVTAALPAPIEHRAAQVEEVEEVEETEEEEEEQEEELKVVAAVPAVAAEATAAKPRRPFFGALRREVAPAAEVKLPAVVPAAIVARPRRGDKAANGKAKPVAGPAAKPAPGPIRRRSAKKPS